MFILNTALPCTAIKKSFLFQIVLEKLLCYFNTLKLTFFLLVFRNIRQLQTFSKIFVSSLAMLNELFYTLPIFLQFSNS